MKDDTTVEVPGGSGTAGLDDETPQSSVEPAHPARWRQRFVNLALTAAALRGAAQAAQHESPAASDVQSSTGGATDADRTAALSPAATKRPPPLVPWKTLRNQLAGVVKLIWANPAGATFFLVAVGALGFGWAWSLDAFFYAEVGVSPQVVGASYPNVLASAFLGYVMLVLLVFSVFLVVLAVLWLFSRLSPRFEDVGPLVKRRWRWWLGVVLVLVGVEAVFNTAPLTRRGIGLLTLAVFVAWVVTVLSLARSQFEETGLLSVTKYLAVFVVVVMLPTSFLFARADALSARNGVTDPHLFSPLFPWQARVARLVWHGRPPVRVVPGCVIYLGETSNGPLLLAELPNGGRDTFVVRPSDGTVLIEPEYYECGFHRLK